MPIKAKVVPADRKRLEAQGRLGSARKLRDPVRSRSAASDGSSSSTSSDSDASSVSERNRVAVTTKKETVSSSRKFVDPVEDHAAYANRQARQEWMYATGQAGAVPSPPPKLPPSSLAATAAGAAGGAPSPGAASRALRAAAPSIEASRSSAAETNAAQKSSSGTRLQYPSSASTTSVAAPAAATSTPAAKPSVNEKRPAVAVRTTPPSQPAAVSLNPAQAAPISEDVKEGPEPQPPRVPDAASLVTDEEERANPGRRDFLRLLDLLDEPSRQTTQPEQGTAASGEGLRVPGAAAEAAERTPLTTSASASTGSSTPPPAQATEVSRPKPPKGATMQQRTEFYFDMLYREWLESEADVTFMALEQWHRAEALAHLDQTEGFDPSEWHQAVRQAAVLTDARNERLIRYTSALNRLEEFVISDAFVQRVNKFLHKYHVGFLKSAAARERGEFQHAEHEVWNRYASLMEQLVIADLKRHVEGFNEEEFFDMLFENETAGDENTLADSAADASGPGNVSGVSFQVWEVLLSFLRFDHFCNLMDEYIAVHYGADGGTGVSGILSSSSRRAGTGLSGTSNTSGSQSAQANSGSQKRPSVSSSSLSTTASLAKKPVGGVAVKHAASAASTSGSRPVANSRK